MSCLRHSRFVLLLPTIEMVGYYMLSLRDKEHALHVKAIIYVIWGEIKTNYVFASEEPEFVFLPEVDYILD